MLCLTCQGRGLTFHTLKGYQVPTIYNPKARVVRPCHMCRKGRIVKKFNLLEQATKYNPTIDTTRYKREVVKIMKTLEKMEMKNERL